MENSIANFESETLSPCRSQRRSSASNSPEFEFWMVRNPSCPHLNLLSADELFVDGVLLPLQLLHLHTHCDLPKQTLPPEPGPPNAELPPAEPNPDSDQGSGPSASITESNSSFSSSKRWKYIFKKSDKKSSVSNNSAEDRDRDREEKKREKKSGNGRSSSAELNINIWPFSRSRSAGNSGTRPKVFSGAPGTRKVNSAPCSRSNSAGESKSRKWPSSPSRPGVHLGRSSPVWQVKHCSSGHKNSSDFLPRNAEKGFKKEPPEGHRSKVTAKSGGDNNGKAKVLNLKAPTCIGYRQNLSCRSEGNGTIGVVGGGESGGGSRANTGGVCECDSVGSSRNLFNLRNLFTKKSALASH